LGFLGVELSQMSDAQNAPLILPDSGRVNVRVIRTDEELMLARSTARVLNLGSVRQT
jgi:acetate kinase